MTTLRRLVSFVALGGLLNGTLDAADFYVAENGKLVAHLIDIPRMERSEPKNPNPPMPKFELEPWTPGVLEMHEPGVSPLFTIGRVESDSGQLSVYIYSSNPDAVSEAIESGKLEAQLSEHDEDGGGTASEVSFRFMKKVRCTGQSEVTIPYEEAIPSSCTAEDISLFFAVDLVLGPWRDLAFGYDPGSLWLVR